MIVRKLIETGIMRIDFGDEEDFEKFFEWLYSDE